MVVHPQLPLNPCRLTPLTTLGSVSTALRDSHGAPGPDRSPVRSAVIYRGNGRVQVAHLPDDRAFYTVKEAAAIVKCSERTMYRYIEAGIIEAKQGPTQKLIPRDSLQAFIDSFPGVGGAG